MEKENRAYLMHVQRLKRVDLIMPKSLAIADDFRKTHKKAVEIGKNKDGDIIGEITYSSKEGVEAIAKDFSDIYGGSFREYPHEFEVIFPETQKSFLEKAFLHYFSDLE
mgnify:CR=1 FL=1